jgi:hypothetical protein
MTKVAPLAGRVFNGGIGPIASQWRRGMVQGKARKMVQDNGSAVQWKTVSDSTQTDEETKIIWDTVGDDFVGTYLGMREIESDSGKFKQARFSADGVTYFCNANYSLRQGLKDVRPRTLVRVEFTSEQDTGQDSPMRVFTVQVAIRSGKAGTVSDNS